MICHKCGEMIKGDAEVCPFCETLLETEGSFFDTLAKIEEYFLSACLASVISK